MDERPFTESHIRDADLIVPRVYLSGLRAAQDAAVAASLGITHIVSILDFHPTFPDEMRHIKKIHVMLSDSFRERITPHLDDTTAFIREALESNSENKVLVCPASFGGGGYVCKMAANPRSVNVGSLRHGH